MGLWTSARIRFGRLQADRGVAQSGQSIGLQNRGPKVRILAPLPLAFSQPQSAAKSNDQVDSQFLGSRTLDPLGLGPLAQLAERRADNAEVGGSSPPRPTPIRPPFHDANRIRRKSAG